MSNEWISLDIIFILLHILGTAIGAGAAFTGDFIFLSSARKRILTKSEIRIFKLTGKIVWLGLLILTISGIGLFFERPDIYWHSGKFWAKMAIVLIIAINGLAFHFLHRPL